MSSVPHASGTKAWSTSRFTGQKRALKPREVWSIRIRLEIAGKKRELALFNLAIDSKLRGCDLMALRVEDVCVSGRVRKRAIIIQRKTGKPVQFEITELTRQSLQSWIPRVACAAASCSPVGITTARIFRQGNMQGLCAWLSRKRWFKQCRLRHAFAAADQGSTDLPQDRKSPRRSIAARSHKAGKHCPISWG